MVFLELLSSSHFLRCLPFWSYPHHSPSHLPYYWAFLSHSVWTYPQPSWLVSSRGDVEPFYSLLSSQALLDLTNTIQKCISKDNQTAIECFLYSKKLIKQVIGILHQDFYIKKTFVPRIAMANMNTPVTAEKLKLRGLELTFSALTPGLSATWCRLHSYGWANLLYWLCTVWKSRPAFCWRLWCALCLHVCWGIF